MFVSFLKSAIGLSAVFLYGSTGETVIEKGGHLNLGIPGVISVGAAVGCFTEYLAVSAFGRNAAFPLVLLPLITTIIAGVLMGLLYSFLTVSLRANQNVVGLAMTTFGVGLAGFIATKMGDKVYLVANAGKYYINMFSVTSDNWFVQIFLSHGFMVYLAIIIAIVAQIVLSKTRLGLNLRAVGENPATADAAGINVTKYKYVSTCIGSAIASLGGLCCLMDFMGGNWDYTFESFGWLAIALVIFTMWRPALSIVGSLIFGGLYIAVSYIGGITFAQIEIIKLLPYVVTIIVLIITSIFDKKGAQPPAALGVSYFREER